MIQMFAYPSKMNFHLIRKHIWISRIKKTFLFTWIGKIEHISRKRETNTNWMWRMSSIQSRIHNLIIWWIIIVVLWFSTINTHYIEFSKWIYYIELVKKIYSILNKQITFQFFISFTFYIRYQKMKRLHKLNTHNSMSFIYIYIYIIEVLFIFLCEGKKWQINIWLLFNI